MADKLIYIPGPMTMNKITLSVDSHWFEKPKNNFIKKLQKKFKPAKKKTGFKDFGYHSNK